MRIKTFTTLGLAGGMLALAFSLSIPLANGAPASAPLLQPSPRPTLVPTSAPQPTGAPTSAPTSAATTVATAVPTAKPHATSTSKNDDTDDVVHYGRVTGTVIDQRTGAPVSHVKVMVGTYALMTDVSGNYDLWLPTGTYDVVLSLGASQGTPVQATAKVTVKADATVVQHLTLRSSAPAAVAPADAAPAVVAPAEVGVSPALNTVPAAASVPAKVVAPAAKEQPTRLPTTGEGDTLPMMMVWLAVALVLMGSMLLIPSVRLALLPMLGMPQANKAADERLLRRLIGDDAKQTAEDDDSFLNDLLR